VCPVYDITRHERFSPRGKFRLLNPDAQRMDFTGGSPESQGCKPQLKTAETLTACLQCGACAAVCPSGVAVDALVRGVRRGVEPARSAEDWLWFMLGSPQMLSLVSGALAVLPRSSGLLARLMGMARQECGASQTRSLVMPSLARRPALRRRICRQSQSSGHATPGTVRIAYFLGCIQNYVYPEVAEAIVSWFGGEIIVPSGQGCCGMPAWAAGNDGAARSMAKENVRLLAAARPDFVLVGCASCAAMLREWPVLLSSMEPEGRMAAALAGRVREFSQLVEELDIQPPVPPRVLDGTVTYHAPCHQRYGADTVVSETLVDRLSSGKYVPTAAGCCGQGGLFGLSRPDLSIEIFQKRLDAVERSRAVAVVTTCSGCLLQWRAGTAGLSAGPKVFHLAELACVPRAAESRL